MSNSPYRINIGCGMSPTPGWLNFDNSPSVRLAKYPILMSLLKSFRLIGETQIAFIQFCKHNAISWADVTKKIPLPNQSVEIIYSSHMLEHLDPGEVEEFLFEVKRILMKGGTLRLAIPDLEKIINGYLANRDANEFISSLNICKPRPKTLQEKFRILTVGARHHQWQYDSASLSKLLLKHGFSQVKTLKIGETNIPNPGALNLFEDAGASMYVEAIY